MSLAIGNTTRCESFVRLCLAIGCFALVGGCGGSGPTLAPVTGRVTFDGQPLENADVEFQPDDMQRPSIGRTEADGSYRLRYKQGMEGARVGTHTVRITVSPSLVRNPPKIPPRYNKDSELRREVESGDNVFDFDLKTDSGK